MHSMPAAAVGTDVYFFSTAATVAASGCSGLYTVQYCWFQSAVRRLRGSSKVAEVAEPRGYSLLTGESAVPSILNQVI